MGVPREWAYAYAILQTLTCPDWIAPDRWQRIVDTARTFVRKWSRAATALRWDAREFMGLSEMTPAIRPMTPGDSLSHWWG